MWSFALLKRGIRKEYILPSALLDQTAQLRIEILCLLQLLQREMHPVAPIMFWVSRDVDALGLHVRTAQWSVHSQQVLQLKDAPHGGRLKVPAHNGPHYFRPGFAWGFSLHA